MFEKSNFSNKPALVRIRLAVKISLAGTQGPVFGCFVGGVGTDKVPSGFTVHLISLRNSSKTSERGALSMPKRNHETHYPPNGTLNSSTESSIG
jgi:hypothetical protein